MPKNCESVSDDRSCYVEQFVAEEDNCNETSTPIKGVQSDPVVDDNARKNCSSTSRSTTSTFAVTKVTTCSRTNVFSIPYD
jgi:hypothetical protein